VADNRTENPKLCDCVTSCCLHVYADLMLEKLYKCAAECANCDGDGKVERGDDAHFLEDECAGCKDIRILLRIVDPCGDLLARAEKLKREAAEESDNDLPF